MRTLLPPTIWYDGRRARVLLVALCLTTIASFAGPAAAAATLSREGIEGNNPTIAQKVLGYHRWVRAHGGPPDVLILGTSRAGELDPRFIRSLTGSTTYNAGVSNAGAREYLAMLSYADLRSPGKLPEVLMLLDVEAFDGRNSTVRVRNYQARILRTRAACGDPVHCRRSWQRSAAAIAADALARQRGGRPMEETQDLNGHQINGDLARWARQGADFVTLLRYRIKLRSEGYGPGEFDHLYHGPRTAIRLAVALANARGITPRIAITSMHPACVRICGPRGWRARRAETRRFLRALDLQYDLRWIDLSFASTWGGSGAYFYDDVHIRPTAARLIVRRLNRFGAFRVPPPAS